MSNCIRGALSETIDRILLPLLGGDNKHICIIDPPGHPNVGDSAILLGELDFISRHFPNAKLSYYDVDSYKPAADRFIEDATILLIHGGGNFGDIWPHHHMLRLRILDRFRHKPILQMPQSIHFDNCSELQATAAIIAKHPNFILAIRDQRSLEYAQRHFDCKSVLCPDMAFSMRPIFRNECIADYFGLLRTDKEAIINRDTIQASLAATNRSIEVMDWLDEPRDVISRLDNKAKHLTAKLPSVTAPFSSIIMRLRSRYARQRVVYGIGLLSRGATVVTDRLHAHIMCCLLDIPHYIFDSYDRKISAFYETWTTKFPKAYLVDSVAQIVDRENLLSHQDSLSSRR